MADWRHQTGLKDLGNGLWGYVQADGSWGWSNAGLVADSGETLLIDTLFDLNLTGEMLRQMRAAVPAARKIGTLLNTHHNGDHTFGNELVAGAEIIASKAAAEEMDVRPVTALAEMIATWRERGAGGAFFYEVMGSKFVFAGIKHTPPTRTFEKRLDIRVGTKDIEIHELGPAHTKGDVVAYVPSERTVFAGDLVFVGGHPVLWAGPAQNWIDAADRILSWDVDVVVPGHGAITDKAGVRAMRDYFVWLREEAKKRFDAGLSAHDAAWDIALDGWSGWLDAERIIINVNSLYREFGGAYETDTMTLFAQMRGYRKLRCGGEGLIFDLPGD